MRAFTRRPTVLLLAAILAFTGGLFVALLPITPGSAPLQEGDLAFRTIRAPRDISFESPTLTAKRRDEAAAAVPESLVYDPSVAITQQSALTTLLGRLTAVRDDPALSEAAKTAALARIDKLNLSQRSASLLLSLANDQYQSVEANARRALASVLDESLPASAISEARERASTYVDPAVDRDTATLAAELIRPFIVPNLITDIARTEAAHAAARAGVAAVKVTFARNQVIVEKDTVVTAEAHEALIQAGLLHRTWEPDLLGANALLSLLVSAVVVAGVLAFRPAILSQPRQLLATGLGLAVSVLVVKMYLPLILPDDSRHFLAYALPVASISLLLCALLGAEVALLIAGATALVATFAAVYLSDLTVVGLAGTLDVVRLALAYGFGAAAGVLVVRNADRLSRFLLGGLAIGACVLGVLLATWLIDPNRSTADLSWMALSAAASGGLSAFIGAGMFVTVGSLFGVVTRVQLLEMSQLSQPLLHRLQDEAPATFQHSVIVANLAEKGAYVIGADALLTRVGCYYHDIGKLMRPGFFIENQLGGANPHDALDPQDSARIIIDHVLAGRALARQHRLPQRVADFIPEHHGTRLVTYFYRLASEEDPTVSTETFRYPGPRPRSRETAITMLADSCEALVRADRDHSPEAIDRLVEEVFAERLAESQLDESDLTLGNLRDLAQSFKETLRAVYHPRVEYPAPTRAELLLRRLPLPRILDRR